MKAPLETLTLKKSTLPDGHPISAVSTSAFVLSHMDHINWMKNPQRTA